MGIIPMKCSSCGAPLEVDPEMESFSCGYCGAALMVERKGGTIALKMVAEGLKAVQAGTDKTAAELAIQRLQRRLIEVQSRYAQAMEAWQYEQVNSAGNLVSVILVGVVMIGAMFMGLAFLFTGVIGKDPPLAIIGLLFVAAGVWVFIRSKGLKGPRRELEAKRKKAESQINSIRREWEKLNQEIAKQEKIVTSTPSRPTETR